MRLGWGSFKPYTVAKRKNPSLTKQYTLTRDDMLAIGEMIYTALRAMMIYQVCDLNKKTLVLWNESFFGADYGARTRHLHLGKVALYQMS